MGRFFVAVQKCAGRLCDNSAPDAVTFLQPDTFVYAILALRTARIAE
jgi:hypothetical protein